MCGIVGYVGHRPAVSLLVEGLKRLEYRGYDSAGVSVFSEDGDRALVVKTKGKIADLEGRLMEFPLPNSTIGIGHTRWATHGAPSDRNAHPHLSCDQKIAIVHNGIVENADDLRLELERAGHRFRSETDSEVFAHLISFYSSRGLSLVDAVSSACRKVYGTYGLAVMHTDHPNELVAARSGSPLILGIGDGEHFIGSDVAAFVSSTRRVVYLDDGELAHLTPGSVRTYNIGKQNPVEKPIHHVDWDLGAIQKGGHPHFMHKEIFEQADALRDICRGRLDGENGTSFLGGLENTDEAMERITAADEVIFLGCGTAMHAAIAAQYMFESIARIPARWEDASEYRYRNPVLRPGSIGIVISQSGETVDTLAAMREIRRRGNKVYGLINVVGSTIARENDGGVYLHAGPEIGVASTKAFTNMLMGSALLCLAVARRRDLSLMRGKKIVKAIQDLPEKIEQIFALDPLIQQIADRISKRDHALYLGRGYNYPIALEGALKLKEISYIHAEGYPAAAMKHGPIALIDAQMPVVVIATREDEALYEKILSNVEEVRARGGDLYVIANVGDDRIGRLTDQVIFIPEALENFLTPILSNVPLQLLAYHCAVNRGLNVDQPRNLAKAVTVE